MEFTNALYRVVKGAKYNENIIGHTPVLRQAIEAAKGYVELRKELYAVFSYDQDLNKWFLEEAYCVPKFD